MRVLAIDDDAAACRTLGGLLAGDGIGFIEATDGSSGLKLFYNERPDLVVLNLGLSSRPAGKCMKKPKSDTKQSGGWAQPSQQQRQPGLSPVRATG